MSRLPRRIRFGNNTIDLKVFKQKDTILYIKLTPGFFNKLPESVPKYTNGIIFGIYEGIGLKAKNSKEYEFLLRYGKNPEDFISIDSSKKSRLGTLDLSYSIKEIFPAGSVKALRAQLDLLRFVDRFC